MSQTQSNTADVSPVTVDYDAWREKANIPRAPEGIDPYSWYDAWWHAQTHAPVPEEGDLYHYYRDVGFVDGFKAAPASVPASTAPVASGNKTTTWGSFFGAAYDDASIGSAFYSVLTKGFPAWLSGDPMGAIAVFFRFGRVLSRASLVNLTKGSKNLILGVSLVAATLVSAWILFETHWKSNHRLKAVQSVQTAVVSGSPLPPVQAQAAQSDLDARVQKTSAGLEWMGMDQRTVRQSAAENHLIVGTDIALRAQAFQGADIVTAPAIKGNAKIVGSSPIHYVPLTQLDVNAYLKSLSNPRVNQGDILQNSAAIHGVTLANIP